MKRLLLRALLALAAIAIISAGFVAFRFHALSNKAYAAPSFTISEEVASADPTLGHRIYAVRAGCIDCHGPDGAGAPIMDNGTMGSIRGANLTPYALSEWTDEQIAAAIRYGIHREGRSLRFMPSFDYAGLSKGDIAALIAYLRSLPPAETPPSANSFGPVARMLSSLGKMPVMFPAATINLQQGFAEKPAEGPTAAFGRYLAHACIGCHGERLEGGPIPGGDPSWPPAGSVRLGANPVWTEDSFKQMMATGISPTTGQPLRPPMPVELMRQMNDDEVTALWEYLHTLK